MTEYERRYTPGIEELQGKLVGYAVVFNRASKIIAEHGRLYREIIAPEAVTSALRAGTDIHALVDHDVKRVLGRTKSGTLRYSVDAHGVKVEIDPPDTSYARDVMESVRRGDIDGMSFQFVPARNGVSWSFDGDVPVRTIRHMTHIQEFSVVTVPAFADATVALRSLDQYIEEQGVSTKLLRLRLKLAETE